MTQRGGWWWRRAHLQHTLPTAFEGGCGAEGRGRGQKGEEKARKGGLVEDAVPVIFFLLRDIKRTQYQISYKNEFKYLVIAFAAEAKAS